MKARFSLLAVIIPFLLSGCGGGSSTPPPPPQFTIGGSVSGLAGTGLVLQDNGGDNLSVSASGNFTFKTSVTSGGAYKVTVLTQPSSPAQTCAVTSGSGTATANVTNVQVTCTTVTHTIAGTVVNLVGTNGGLQLDDNGNDLLSVNANGAFTFATAVADGSAYAVTISMQPTNPAQTCGVTNGTGTATANVTNVAVDCGHNEWTWVGGTNRINQSGVYGTLGQPAPANLPGGRGAATTTTWVDKSGNFWLFGGTGYDATGAVDNLNDLWEYGNGKWTWVGGSDLIDQPGAYGTKGTPSSNNMPGARSDGNVWTDASGNVWLFGGNNIGAPGGGYFNDLWEYSNGEWTWMGGTPLLNQKGMYGSLGTPSSSNMPGGRAAAASWIDASGNLWLFGAQGYDSAGTQGELNDLWKFSAGQWTWMGGPNLANQRGGYGALGTPNSTNIPGARDSEAMWTDASGNVWLFGGNGYDSAGTGGYLNDLWKYSNGQWSWMGGSIFANQIGEYGTLGMSSANNIPGARRASVTWTDASGNFWLFGGEGYDVAGRIGQLSDLWKYSNGEWTWVGGSQLINQPGMYFTAAGTPSPTNFPGGRRFPAGWIDAQGNLWMFGGHGYDVTGNVGQLNDLWMYKP